MAQASSQRPTSAQTGSREAVELWTPVQLSVVTFIFGFAAGTGLASINWRRMGLRKLASTYVLVAIVGVVLLFVVTQRVPNQVSGLIYLVVNVAAMFYLRGKMAADVANFRSGGGQVERDGWLRALLVGLVGVALTAVLLFLTALVLAVLGLLPSPP